MNSEHEPFMLSTYFIYYLFQDNFKNGKMMKIQEVHQKIHAKQFLLFYLNCFLFVTHLNLMRLKSTRLI